MLHRKHLGRLNFVWDWKQWVLAIGIDFGMAEVGFGLGPLTVYWEW